LSNDDRPVTETCEHAKLADVRVGFRYLGDSECRVIEELSIDL